MLPLAFLKCFDKPRVVADTAMCTCSFTLPHQRRYFGLSQFARKQADYYIAKPTVTAIRRTEDFET